jgi:cyanophycin synthetase
VISALRGPNLLISTPALVAEERASDAQRVADLAIALQQAAGAKVSSRVVEGSALAVEYEEEELGRACLEAARQAVAAGRDWPDADVVERLRDLGDSILIGPNTRALYEAARDGGIPVRRLDKGSLLQLGHGVRQRRLCGAETDRTSSIGEGIGWDKPVSKELLRAVGVPIPEGREVTSPEDAWGAAGEFGGYVVVKPKSANHGRSVFIGLTRREEIEAAYEAAIAEGEDRGVVVERCVSGAEHRVLVIEGAVVAATRGDPLYVEGDGKRTIQELMDEVNRDPRRGDAADCPLSPVGFDDVTQAIIARQGFGPQSVPGRDVLVLIQRNGNLGVDVTDQVHPANAAIAALAARTVGLDIAGIDMVVGDISKPMREQAGAVLEVNAMPGLLMHLHPASGAPRPVHERIVEAVVPRGSDARIPVVVVHDDGEEAPTARAIAARLIAAGLFAGVSCSAGTFANGELTHSGDRASAAAAADLLLHPLLEAAVFETRRGRIAAEGLGFDLCDVVVLGDSADNSPEAALLRRVVRKTGTVIAASPDPTDTAAAVLDALKARP